MWFEGIETLTPVSVWDCANYDQASQRFLDYVGTNHLSWPSSGENSASAWKSRSGPKQTVGIPAPITPTENFTAVVFCNVSRKTCLLAGDTGYDGIWKGVSNDSYIASYGENGGIWFSQRGFSRPNVIIVTKSSTFTKIYIDGVLDGTNNSPLYFPRIFSKVMSNSDPAYNMADYDEFFAAGLFSGTATDDDVKILNEKLRKSLSKEFITDGNPIPSTSCYMTPTVNGYNGTLSFIDNNRTIQFKNDNTTYESLFKINAGQKKDGYFELDLELYEDTTIYNFFGVDVSSGNAYESIRFGFYENKWVLSYIRPVGYDGTRDFKTCAAGATTQTRLPGVCPNVVDGETKRFKVCVKQLGPSITSSYMEFWVDGVLIFEWTESRFYTHSIGVFGLNNTVRTNRIVTGADSGIPSVAYSKVFKNRIARKSLGVVGYNAKAFPLKISKKDIYFGGDGKIVATVKEVVTGTTDKIPVYRRVVLIDSVSMIRIKETWSDAITGEYRFENLDKSRVYIALAFDHTGKFTAIAADNLKAI